MKWEILQLPSEILMLILCAALWTLIFEEHQSLGPVFCTVLSFQILEVQLCKPLAWWQDTQQCCCLLAGTSLDLRWSPEENWIACRGQRYLLGLQWTCEENHLLVPNRVFFWCWYWSTVLVFQWNYRTEFAERGYRTIQNRNYPKALKEQSPSCSQSRALFGCNGTATERRLFLFTANQNYKEIQMLHTFSE